MPQDRLRSPRAGHGRRTASLSDFEYRVWDQYQLSADDFGVMRFSALTIQDDNDALAERPAAEVKQALEKLVEVGLVVSFEHQGRQYVCQTDWQAFQKVEYPRVTLLPKPPPAVLQQCEGKTRRLFAKHPGGSPKKFPKRSRSVPEETPTNARARRRETANGKRLTQTANTNGQRPTAKRTAERFGEFWAAYPNKKAKDAARAAWRKRQPDDALLARILAAIHRQKQSPAWRKDGGQYIPHPATWLNQGRWEDESAEVPLPLVSEKTQQNQASSEEALRLIEEGTYGHRR